VVTALIIVTVWLANPGAAVSHPAWGQAGSASIATLVEDITNLQSDLPGRPPGPLLATFESDIAVASAITPPPGRAEGAAWAAALAEMRSASSALAGRQATAVEMTTLAADLASADRALLGLGRSLPPAR